MDARRNELLETLDALLSDLAATGCHFIVAVLEPNLQGSHYWRTRNNLIAYALAETVAHETHSALCEAEE